MLVQQAHGLKDWLKNHDNPSFRRVFHTLKAIRACDLPTPKLLNRVIALLYGGLRNILHGATRIFINTPAFKGKLQRHGRGLYLFGGVPLVSGPLTISLGNDCRISGQTTFSARPQSKHPQLIVGNNVDIGWQSTIAVGNKVTIGDNVRIAGRAFLFGYSGHSMDPDLRAQGQGDLDCDVGDIILGNDVWLGTNVTICPNVTVGEGTVIGTGSVVTKSLPPFVVAAGNPAKIVKHLKRDGGHHA